MKFENTKVFNFDGAIRGMRNPLESWDKSDSHWMKICTDEDDNEKVFVIGENDIKLAQKLIKAGTEHRKWLRQCFVSVDITAPLYWWKEFDTYKVGTVANSTSTMHKLASTPITMDCFENDDYDRNVSIRYQDMLGVSEMGIDQFWQNTIFYLEKLRNLYNQTKDKRVWKELIRALPESWLQKRTVTFNYENLLAMCSKSQRRFHKLNEWSGIDDSELPNFISWAKTLPYAYAFIFIDEMENENDD